VPRVDVPTRPLHETLAEFLPELSHDELTKVGRYVDTLERARKRTVPTVLNKKELSDAYGRLDDMGKQRVSGYLDSELRHSEQRKARAAGEKPPRPDEK
jgi:hypothetical protein